VRPIHELPGRGRVADRGRLVDVEDYGQVERVGPVGEGLFELPVDTQLLQVAGSPRRIRLAQGALTGPWPTEVLVLISRCGLAVLASAGGDGRAIRPGVGG
jgi:hypothetical protein